MQKNNSRAIAAKILAEIFTKKNSLNAALNNFLKPDSKDRALIQAFCYGVLRQYWQLEALVQLLLKKSLKNKDQDIFALLLLGLYQLLHLRIPDHAAISETVQAARVLKKPWAAGLINATLRQFQREQPHLLEQIAQNTCAHFSHPNWLIEIIKTAWPEQWQNVLDANNQHPPLTLRINSQQLSREAYLQKLGIDHGVYTTLATEGITLHEACDVKQLPGYAAGEFSVQDESAQLAASLLELTSAQTVLDACAAPGGKTAHILEIAPHLTKLVAIDIDEKRIEKVTENLTRLQLLSSSIVMTASNAAEPQIWWDGELFDRILLDAPCSATGVIRRHPDIKYLRRPEDIAQLAVQQLQLLNALWPLLKPNGLLVYATCSVLPQENENVIEAFLHTHHDAHEKIITTDWGIKKTIGRQLLPKTDGHDGFYYARLQKH